MSKKPVSSNAKAWDIRKIQKMDTAFAQALLAAIERGEEKCATEVRVSTAPGTIRPIVESD
jgi:ABC-type transporter Mla MlaB component